MPRDLMEMLAPLFDQATKIGDIEGSDNLLFPKRFSRKHPRIASMVEGAVLGAALTKPSETPGEAVSNVAQAVLGIPEFKKNKQMQKILAPLGMIKQGLEMQKLQSETERNLAAAEYNRNRPQDTDPRYDRYFRDPSGTYGVTPAGIGEEISGIPGSSPTPSAGTDIERFIAKRNAERAARDEAPMNTTEEAAYRAQLRGQKAFFSGFEGAQGRERVAGPIRDRNELLRTEMGLVKDEIRKLESMDDFEYMMENPEANEGDLAKALAQRRELGASYRSHLRMGGDLSWEDYKAQQRQSPYSPDAGSNPYRPDQPR